MRDDPAREREPILERRLEEIGRLSSLPDSWPGFIASRPATRGRRGGYAAFLVAAVVLAVVAVVIRTDRAGMLPGQSQLSPGPSQTAAREQVLRADIPLPPGFTASEVASLHRHTDLTPQEITSRAREVAPNLIGSAPVIRFLDVVPADRDSTRASGPRWIVYSDGVRVPVAGPHAPSATDRPVPERSSGRVWLWFSPEGAWLGATAN